MKATATPWETKDEAMSETPPTPALIPPEKSISEIDIHFEKSKFFRVVHVDGVWFNFGQNNTMRLVFYSESLPIPDKIVGQLQAGQLIGDDLLKRAVRQGTMRELEVDLVLTPAMATDLIGLLQKNIEIMKKMG